MCGAPIVQNGRIVGVVTHVLVQTRIVELCKKAGDSVVVNRNGEFDIEKKSNYNVCKKYFLKQNTETSAFISKT